MACFLISSYSDQILKSAGFTRRVSRSEVEANLCRVLKSMDLSPSEWCGLDAVWYGIKWYVHTGRATTQIESELKSLTGYQLIRLIVKIWLDGCNTPGDTGDWLRKWAGSYAKLAK